MKKSFMQKWMAKDLMKLVRNYMNKFSETRDLDWYYSAYTLAERYCSYQAISIKQCLLLKDILYRYVRRAGVQGVI